MAHIVIFEDNDDEFQQLESSLHRYGEEKGIEISLRRFVDAVDVSAIPENTDVIFMDINMPSLDGMSLSRKIREVSDDVILVFVTNLKQYAIEGYQVNAFDFVLKPVKYYDFALRMNRIMKRVAMRRANQAVVLEIGTNRILSSDIYYIEISNHTLSFYLKDSQIRYRGSLAEVESNLTHSFVRAHSAFLVNLRHVSAIEGNDVLLDNGTTLYLSRGKKKEFVNAFTRFKGGF